MQVTDTILYDDDVITENIMNIFYVISSNEWTFTNEFILNKILQTTSTYQNDLLFSRVYGGRIYLPDG